MSDLAPDRWLDQEQDGAVRAVPSLCRYCIHNRHDRTCDAFPDGIPDRFLTGDAQHTAPVEGDHGIQFELDPDLPD